MKSQTYIFSENVQIFHFEFLIVKCINQQITEDNNQETVLEQMDKLFQEKECKTLQHFRSALEVMGLLPKQKVQSAGHRQQPTN